VLASAHVSQKQYDAAVPLFQALLKKHADDSVLNYAMGSVLFLQAKFDEAAVHLHKSIQANPNQAASYYYLGLIAEEKGQTADAIATFSDVVKRDPEYGPAYEGLGRMLVKEQKYPEAEEALRKAVLLSPGSVKAHYQLGILLGRTGRQEDAQKEIETVRQLNAEEQERTGMRLRILSPH